MMRPVRDDGQIIGFVVAHPGMMSVFKLLDFVAASFSDWQSTFSFSFLQLDMLDGSSMLNIFLYLTVGLVFLDDR